MSPLDPFDKFRLMLDEYSAQILSLTAPKPMNALELSDALGIPIAACYRRIRVLKEAGILREDGKVESMGGKMVSIYRSSVDKAEVVLQDGRLRVFMDVAGEKASDEVMLSDEPTMLAWPAVETTVRKRLEQNGQ
ncbi:MAG TPA: helix-turn-helix domain-containing protein [Thermoplasmata archaeon]